MKIWTIYDTSPGVYQNCVQNNTNCYTIKQYNSLFLSYINLKQYFNKFYHFNYFVYYVDDKPKPMTKNMTNMLSSIKTFQQENKC